MEDQGQEETPHRHMERRPGVSGMELGLMGILFMLFMLLVILGILLIR